MTFRHRLFCLTFDKSTFSAYSPRYRRKRFIPGKWRGRGYVIIAEVQGLKNIFESLTKKLSMSGKKF